MDLNIVAWLQGAEVFPLYSTIAVYRKRQKRNGQHGC